MQTAKEVIETDLEYICAKAHDEFEAMAGKRLLITGGAGFLGYYLVQSVAHWNKTRGRRQPIEAVVYDNFMRGVPDWLEAMGSENLTVRRHDITHPMPSDAGSFDYIIHAASIASPTFYRQYPIETMDANVNGLRYLLEHGLSQGNDRPLAGFLFFSSSEIYGDPAPNEIPTAETYRGSVSCTGPRACYDESKRYGETLCVNFAQQYGMPIRMARPFNNYGPGLKISDRRVIPDFARDVLSGRDIVLLSDGAPRRTFCYVADAIVGYFKVLVRGRAGEAYNIGVPSPEISVAELANRIRTLAEELFDYGGQVIRKVSEDADYLTDNPDRRCPIIDKAVSELGYAPEIGIDEGLRRSLIWYAEHRTAEEA